MTRVPRNKGSYRQRRSGSGFQVRYPLGWNEEKKKYEDYLEEVPTEAEAIALIKLINDYVYHGGIVSDIPYWRKGVLEKKKKQSIPTLDEFFFTFIVAVKGSGCHTYGFYDIPQGSVFVAFLQKLCFCGPMDAF